MRRPDTQDRLRSELSIALNRKSTERAVGLLVELEVGDARNPRWPHKRGDLLRAGGRTRDAVDAYRRAAVLYAEQGFPARADAMANLADQLDSRPSALRRIESMQTAMR